MAANGRSIRGASAEAGLRSGLDRRFFLLGGSVLGVAAATGCTSNEPQGGDGSETSAERPVAATDNDKPGKTISMGFVAPAADHGWIAAIAENAGKTAAQYSDIDWQPVEPTSDIAQQIAAVESFITD